MWLQQKRGFFYLYLPTGFHKTLEVGWQRLPLGARRPGFNVFGCFKTKGDHAGLRFNVAWKHFFFEWNWCDSRHWNDDTNDWEKWGDK